MRRRTHQKSSLFLGANLWGTSDAELAHRFDCWASELVPTPHNDEICNRVRDMEQEL